MVDTADLHNFGQQVKRITRASGVYFQKPRTLFWEWLLFGISSPLREVFEEEASEGALTSLFGLDVEFSGPDFLGVAKEVRAETSQPNTEDYYRFGCLLAYCYTLGIRDLHRFNLVRTQDHLQVVDAEVVFTRLLLPSETLLLPFKDTPFDHSGISRLVDEPGAISPVDAIAILSGYVRNLNALADAAPRALAMITRALGGNPKIPVRHILRDTRSYRNWQSREEHEPHPYLPEELVQLERGDIPYFFKYVGGEDLWHYTSREGAIGRVAVPTHFQNAVDRDASPPSVLLDPRRIRNELFPVGTLFLARKLIPTGWEGRVCLGDTVYLSGTPVRFELTSSGQAYGAKRRRDLAPIPAFVE